MFLWHGFKPLPIKEIRLELTLGPATRADITQMLHPHNVIDNSTISSTWYSHPRCCLTIIAVGAPESRLYNPARRNAHPPIDNMDISACI
jgi:hypothetical protein